MPFDFLSVDRPPANQAVIGRFVLIRELGSGGSGVVWLARDPILKQERALKLPSLETLGSDRAMTRFRAEASKAAKIDHPNVVRLYEADDLGGLCYQVMEYCPLGSLQGWLKARPDLEIDARAAAELVLGLAEGVARIHAAGLIHRDLKPGNVMLVDDGGAATSSASLSGLIPKVGDFGLAKRLASDETGSVGATTSAGGPIGTYLYMSPEQAQGGGSIDERSDVYGLGVILYELLTRNTPFRGGNLQDLLSNIVSRDPVAPRLIRPGLPRDLETIALHCLRKSPAERYGSAREMKDDLERFLGGRPIKAQPVSIWERGVRWTRRHPGWALASTASFLLVVGFIVVLALFAKREYEHAEQLTAQSVQLKKTVEQLKGRALADQIRLAGQSLKNGDAGESQQILRQADIDSGGVGRLNFAWRSLWRESRRKVELGWGHNSAVDFAVLTRDGRNIVSADLGRRILYWDASRLEPLAELVGYDFGPKAGWASSPDGRSLVLGCYDESTKRYEAMVWDLVGLSTLPGPSTLVGAAELPKIPARARLSGEGLPFLGGLRFVYEGRFLAILAATATGRRLDLFRWPLESFAPRPYLSRDVSETTILQEGGDLIAYSEKDGSIELTDAFGAVRRRTTAPRIQHGALFTGGRKLVVAGGTEAFVWDFGAGGQPVRFSVKHPLINVVVAPDGRTICLYPSGGGAVTLRDADSGREWTLADPEEGPLRHDNAHFSLDGRFLITDSVPVGGRGGLPMLWNVATGRRVRVFGDSPLLRAVLDSPSLGGGGKALFASGTTLRIYPLHPEEEPPPMSHPPEAWAAAFSPNGSTLATGGDDGRILFWDHKAAKLSTSIRAHDSTVCCLAYAPGGTKIVSGSLDKEGRLKLWNVIDGREDFQLIGHEGRIRCVAFSPDGSLIASGSDDHKVRIWNANTGECVFILAKHTDRIRPLAFSPDGRSLATGSEDGRLLIWDVATGQLRQTVEGGTQVISLAYHPRGECLAWGDWDGRLTVMNLRDPSTPHVIVETRAGGVGALGFTPGGEVVATGGESGLVRLWNPTTGQEYLTYDGTSPVHGMAFSPDQSSMAICRDNGEVQMVRAAGGEARP